MIDDNYDYSEYEALPIAVKSALTREQWKWLPASEKANIIPDSTMPEVAEDD